MKKIVLRAAVEFVLVAGLMAAVAGTVGAAVIYEDQFDPGSEDDWQPLSNVFVDDWQNWTTVPAPEGGDKVLVITETNHFYAIAKELQDLTDVEVTVLWLDVEIEDDIGRDADFGIELRVQPIPDDPDAERTECYGLEHDGDENDANNVGDPPTHFHLCARGAIDPETGQTATVVLGKATPDVVPRPTGHVWYWMKFKLVGNHLYGKTWQHGTDEPAKYQLEGEDPDNNFPAGAVGLSTWSGTALVALIRVETVEAPVAEWSLY
jgi:hypothetical protein